jgi:FkbM family methyltransferase
VDAIRDQGWWIPFQDQHNTVGILNKQSREYVPKVLKHLKNTRTVIQAGGNVGIYPFQLSKSFDRVVTCEPDTGNRRCLVENLTERDVRNVTVIDGALGAATQRVGLNRNDLNIGMHKVDLDGEDVRMTTIDFLAQQDVDLIWLDVEGMETPILRGAMDTIEKYRPCIAVEENTQVKYYLEYDPVPPSQFLSKLGYRKVAQMRWDVLFVPA